MIASWWARWKARSHALTVLDAERYTYAAEHRCEWCCAPLVNGECLDCYVPDTPMFPKGGCDCGHD